MQRDESSFQVRRLGGAASLYLDGLRLIFSQMVLVGHAASFFGVMKIMQPPNFPWIQSIAVVGFFWLSGFLICHSVLIRKQEAGVYNFSDFLFSRFARIYTGYVPALLLVVLIDWAFVSFYPGAYGFYGAFSLDVALKNMLMLQKFPVDFFYAPMFGSASTWWTLGIEWWLYMFFGWIFLMKKAPYRKIYWAILLIFSIVPLRYAVKGTGHVGIGLSLVWFLACGFAIYKDFICYHVHRKMLLAGCVLFFVLGVIRYKVSMDAYDLIAGIYIGAAILLSTCWLQDSSVSINKSMKSFINITAGYSFTLFLTHYSILYFISKTGLWDGWPAFVISFLLSNLIAAIIAFYTEMRYRSFALFLKKHWKRIINYRRGFIE